MQIYVVKPGDTLFSIGRVLGLAPGFLARYNGLQEPYRLAVGQSLLVLYPEQTVTVQPGDTLTSIAASAGTDVASLYRMNPNLSGSDRIYPGQILVTQLEQAARRPAVVSGYAYPNVSERVLRGILPYAGALAPFTYGFTPEGALVPMDDERLLALAGACGVQPLLHLSTLTATGASKTLVCSTLRAFRTSSCSTAARSTKRSSWICSSWRKASSTLFRPRTRASASINAATNAMTCSSQHRPTRKSPARPAAWDSRRHG